jgi:hypothetical protein
MNTNDPAPSRTPGRPTPERIEELLRTCYHPVVQNIRREFAGCTDSAALLVEVLQALKPYGFEASR